MRRFLVLMIVSAIVFVSIALGGSAFAQSRTAKLSNSIDVSQLRPSYESEDMDGQGSYIKLTTSHTESEDSEH